MSLDEWLVFVVIWTAAGLPLGPSALNCVVSAATDGFYRSLWSIVGILLAAVGHMAAMILGVATVLLTNAELFQIVKFIGAAYLIWMGILLWRQKDGLIPIMQRPPASTWHLVRRAFLISMSNPKAIFAYFAVFSQFLRPDMGLFQQLVVLAPTALIVTAFVYLGYIAMGRGVRRLLRTVRRRRVFNRGVGSVYMLAGIGLAVAESPAPVGGTARS